MSTVAYRNPMSILFTRAAVTLSLPERMHQEVHGEGCEPLQTQAAAMLRLPEPWTIYCHAA